MEILAKNFKTVVVAITSLIGLGGYAAIRSNERPAPSPKAEAAAPAAQPVAHSPVIQYVPPPAYAPAPMPTAPVPFATQPAPAAVETVSFVVASIGRGRDGSGYLNSMPSFRQPGNQSIKLAPGCGVDPGTLLSRTVTATGPSRVNATGGREVTATSAASLSIR